MPGNKSFYLPLTVSLSTKCNRFCSHCSLSADMDGCFLTLKNARFLAGEIARIQDELEAEGFSIQFALCFTGGGEPLMNPRFAEIMETFLADNPGTLGSIVTSGVNSAREEDRLRLVLDRPYARRLQYALSFNDFQKDFPKRIVRTAELLFKNGVDKISIKICQPNEHALRTIHRLDKILLDHFTPWAKEINPLLSRHDAFYCANVGYGMDKIFASVASLKPDDDPETKKMKVSRRFINRHPPNQKELAMWHVSLESGFGIVYRMETKFGTKQITYLPHYLSKVGRARNLSVTEFPRGSHRYPCGYLKNKTDSSLMLGSDGYYYPSCQCPEHKTIRLGHVSGNIRYVLGHFIDVRKKLLSAMIIDDNPYKLICEHCLRVAENKNIFPECA